MICKNCGAAIKDGSTFCGVCGTRNEAVQSNAASATPNYNQAPAYNTVPQTPNYNAAPQAPVYSTAPQTPVYNSSSVDDEKSYFSGTWIGFVGVNLLCAFLSVISLGFAWPALWCFRMRWVYSNTVVNGYRLKFTGKGGQLFGKYIVWFLLTLVTFSIYGLFVPVKYKKWEISHVEIDKKA